MAKKIKPKKINQKPLTLDDLVKYNQKVLFPALDDKFAKMDDKFAKMDDKFANIDDKFAKMDDKFAKMDDSFEKIGGRFAKIDWKFEEIKEEIKDKFDKVLTGQDKILKIIEDLKSEQTMDVAVHKRQDRKLENHEIRIKIAEEKLEVAGMTK